MNEVLVARVRYHIQKAEFMGLKEAESTLLLKETADAIEELQQTVEHYKGCADDWYKEACDYKAQMPRWIPVSERLPDGRESVLALTGDCDIYVCDYIPSVKQFWTIPGDELHIDDITHWMPLPEPPKEES